MFLRLASLIIILTLLSCSNNKEIIYNPDSNKDPYLLYKEGLQAFDENNFFYAHKKFSEAELNFKAVELAAKSSIMSSFSLYGINFYSEAEKNLKRYLVNYPADKYVLYANYLMAIIYYEQIDDEKKDIQPLIKANNQIDFFLKKYPDSEYSSDLKFKKDLIQNQLAAKEMYIAKYYINVQKWVPAINRLKIITTKYDKTVFVEEALHRLVEIHYHLGLEDEAKKYANILGYNYNSSMWYEKSYKIFNKNYKISTIKRKKSEKEIEEKSFLKKIIKMIK
jgi:outer membrane protein assembly factor BamD